MATDPIEPMSIRDQFRFKEYEALLDKIAHTRSDVSRSEAIYPFAIATIYTWTFTHPPVTLALWTAAMMLPLAIALLGIVRLYSRHRAMDLLEAYIRDIEDEIYGKESPLGWERRYHKERPLKELSIIRAVIAFGILTGTAMIAVHSGDLFAEWKRAALTEKAAACAKSAGAAAQGTATVGRKAGAAAC